MSKKRFVDKQAGKGRRGGQNVSTPAYRDGIDRIDWSKHRGAQDKADKTNGVVETLKAI